jgi:hypothetical protein
MMSAIAVKTPAALKPLRTVAASGPQATVLAQLAQALTRALMQGVHDAARLNVATVHALLAPTDGSVEAELGRASESWRFSWRTYEISAATAANVMRLSEVHARKGFDSLWEMFERQVDGQPSFDPASVGALRDAFEELRAAQLQMFEAAIEAHRRLITLATGGAQ